MGRFSEKRLLNLGAGNKYWPGFENLDSEVDLQNLDYLTDSVDEIHAIHLFEHLPRVEIGHYLDEWYRILKPGGILCLEMPCMDKIAKLIVEGEEDLRFTLLGIFGDPRTFEAAPLMRHEWCYQKKEILELLRSYGFHCEEIQEPIFHFSNRDMRIVGKKL